MHMLEPIRRIQGIAPDPAVKGSLYNLSSLVPKIEFVVTKGSAEKEILLSQASAEPRTSLEVIKTKLHKFGIN